MKNNRNLRQWHKQALDPVIKRVEIVWLINEQGDMCASTPEQHRQEVGQLKAKGDEAVKDYLKKVKTIRAKNLSVLRDKQASDAMTILFVWAIATGWCDYNEWLSPKEQREMLATFYSEALNGIKQTRIKKARYVTITKAYNFAKRHLIRFREKQGIPNDKPLSEKQGKEIWKQIASMTQWKKLVNQHAKRSKESEEKESDPHAALRAGVNLRWREEFQKKAEDSSEDTAA